VTTERRRFIGGWDVDENGKSQKNGEKVFSSPRFALTVSMQF
jgi:hypothetical protein